MVHLSEEVISELVDGCTVAGAEDHLASCSLCRSELEALRCLRTDLRDLADLEAPAGLWTRIEADLPGARRGRLGRLPVPGRVVLRAVGVAAVFVLGLGLGTIFESRQGEGAGTAGLLTSDEPTAESLADALADVRRRGAEYDAALQTLQRLAAEQGAPAPDLAQQRLASLDLLVDASRTALAAEPADPVLNSYLFAALEEREAVLRELQTAEASGTERLWR